MAVITGSMAEAKWGVPEEIRTEAWKRMDEELLETFSSFNDRVR